MRRTLNLSLTCEYVLEPPVDAAAEVKPLVALTLHGYGQNAEDMLRLTRAMLGPDVWIASLRGPHPFTIRPFTSDTKVGFNWGTSPVGWAEAIDLHHRYVLEVLEQLTAEIGRTDERTLLTGFSQPVGMNYRFIATHPGRVRGVIGICGGVPREWEQLGDEPVTESILHISRTEDEFYPKEKAETFGPRLRSRAQDVECLLIPGRHRFPSNAAELVAPWLSRVF